MVITTMFSVLLRPWPDVPIFHRLDDRERNPHIGDYTVCGRAIGPMTPFLPTKHVVKFARPCKGCFPR